jgi:hypothetical protein
LEARFAELKKYNPKGILIPLRVEPPTQAGAIDLGELSDELKQAYSLVELIIRKRREEMGKPEKNRNQNFLDELETDREDAVKIFRFLFCKQYGDNELISHYSDSRVYQIPNG